MNHEELKALLKLLEESGFHEIEYSEGDMKLRVVKSPPHPATPPYAPPPAPPAAAPVATPAGEEIGVSLDFNAINEITTPVAGVFYAAPAPDALPFVKVGDRVKKGDTLCIVEAMKTMNEIQSEFDGEIVDCCVENGQFVEYNQVLFKIF